jgi:acylphosphatase
MMKARAHLFLKGRVQGVFFRSYTHNQARLSNVSGWVRNLSDGRVEAVFEGERGQIEKVIDFCKQGPTGSKVESVEIKWEKPKLCYSKFEIRT